MSIPDSVAKTGVPSMADGSMRSQWQMAIGTSRQRRRWSSSQNTHVYISIVHTQVHMHRCAKGTDEDGAGWGGSMAPINGLIMAATQDGTPCWEEIHPMKEFGKYGNTLLPGNWNRVRSMEMNHLIVVVVRGGKNSESGAVDSVLCLFVCLC